MSDNLSLNQIYVLSALVSGEKYGLEIIKAGKEYGVNLILGSLYNVLDSLERKGFIKSSYKESTESRMGNRRKYYKITASGEHKLSEDPIILE